MSDLVLFTPLKSEPQYRSLVAFDIEGHGGPGGFVCGAVAGAQDTRFYTDAGEMWRDLTGTEYGSAWRVAFNLEYDLSVLNMDALLDGGVLMGSTGLLWYECPDQSGDLVKFIDAARLFRGYSLAEVGDVLGLPKLDLSDDAWHALRYGLAWSDIPSDLQAEIAEYNCRDAELTLLAAEQFQQTLLELGGQLRETLASCAMDLYRRVYMPHVWRAVGPQTNELVRPAFYGGRCEPFLMGVTGGVDCYDANSLYPYIVTETAFPDPGYLDLTTESRLPSDLESREGIAAVRVRVPACDVPALPCRVRGGLFFPVGEWWGVYCLNELRHALECGVEVLSVEWMVSTKKVFNPFVEYVEGLYAKRQEYAQRNAPEEQVIKLLLNSLFGRFGVRTDTPLTYLERVEDVFDPEADWGLYWRRRFGVDFLERPLEQRGPPLYANCLIAAQVTAGARVFLHKHLLEHARHVVYCDTDSIITGLPMATGDGLGEWKAVMQNGQADVVGPKEYRVIMQCGDVRAYAKGVPRELADSYLMQGWARYERALSIREAHARQKWPAEWVEVYQQAGYPLPKRCPVNEMNATPGPTLTLPWSWQLLDQLTQSPRPHLSEVVGGPAP